MRALSLSLSLSLSLLLSLPAHATPAVPTATAVPTVSQSPFQNPQACIDPAALLAAEGAILPTGVPWHEYIFNAKRPDDPNNYICTDFARDECLAQRKFGMRAWKLGFGFKNPLGRVKCVLGNALRCAGGSLVRGCWRAPEGKQWNDPEIEKYFMECLEKMELGPYRGHAVVTIEVTDAATARAGLHQFAVYEPQLDGSRRIKAGEESIFNLLNKRILCAWTQKSEYPILPDACVNELNQISQGYIGEICPELLKPEERWLKFYNCNEKMDGRDRSPQPTPTPALGSPRGNEMWGRGR